MPYVANDYILEVDTRTQDSTKGVIKDNTAYGTPNQNRNSTANVMVVAQLDGHQGTLTFVDGIDNSDPLNALQWYFLTSIDAIYRFFYFVVSPYSNSVTYDKEEVDTDGNITQYANIIYHPTSQKFYKAIGNSFINIEPTVTVGWQTYWEEFTNFASQVSYKTITDKVLVVVHDDLISFKFEDCLKDDIVDFSDEELKGVCESKKLEKYVREELLLVAAESENWQSHSDRSDFIIRQATKKFGCC